MVDAEGAVRVLLNLSGAAVDLPEGELLLASAPVVAGQLPATAAAWVAMPPATSLAEAVAARVGSLVSGLAEALDPRT